MRDKVAIVTGGARGIGKACALALAEEGAHVAVADVISMEDVKAEIKSLGRHAIGIKTNVSRKEEVNHMVARVIEKFRRVDILVNNAGTCQRVPL